MYKVADVPEEVIWVWYIQKYVHYVGEENYNKAREIIKKYPEYFKWETLYNSIPKEVHEAYMDEKYPDRHKPIEPRDCKGVSELIKESSLHYYTKLSIKDMVNYLEEMERKEKEKKAKDKALWSKHYSKFGLEYREL